MFIYSLKKRFDPNTGDEVDPIMKPCEKICDYTGQIIDSGEDNCLYAMKLHYDDSSEQAWYYDDERSILEDDMNVSYEDFGSFIEGPYHFSISYGDDGEFIDQSFNFIKEWTQSDKDNPLYEATTIDRALRIIRYRTLFRLLKEGKYKLKDFGLLTENDYSNK